VPALLPHTSGLPRSRSWRNIEEIRQERREDCFAEPPLDNERGRKKCIRDLGANYFDGGHYRAIDRERVRE